ncbi:mitochondrial 54S ribosomal protein uL23m [Apiospora aurea]|uniref:Large ribosomal subunit protein uL23m n=1 Tax=Apiospora aurea TaxID=335848 RepID=A0ABR1QKJ5_9PEZI
MAAAAASKPFKTGLKQVYLPDHVITFCRPTRQSQLPQFATFKVPLHFNKLDMRDYLLHAYSVASLGVRSAVMRQPVARNPVTRRVQRPPAIKYMTVELAKPFVWPKEPTKEERKQWHDDMTQKRFELQEKQEKQMETYQKYGKLVNAAGEKRTADRTKLAKQAKDLVSGAAKWDNRRELDPKWTES